jgi:hypothetical protein
MTTPKTTHEMKQAAIDMAIANIRDTVCNLEFVGILQPVEHLREAAQILREVRKDVERE